MLDKLDFSFHMPTRLVFKEGALDKLKSIVTGNNVLIVCDPFLKEINIADDIAKLTGAKNIDFFSEVEPNPSCETVDAAVKIGREHNTDVVIGLGGGSAMDTAKMVSCLVDAKGSIYDYYGEGTKTIKRRKAQLILIPTTSGTGSEVTNIGVYTSRKTGIKMPFATDFFFADVALIEPTLTRTLSPAFTASTGMDAFCHAIEAYWSINANPVSSGLAVSALRLIVDNIKMAHDEPDNMDARSKMSLASVMAGVAFSQTKTTGIHALSFPLTTDFGASHGVACAITLPAFIKVCYEGAKEKMDYLIYHLKFKNINDFSDGITKLMESMEMPVKLSQLGVKESDLENITEIGMKPALMDFTPTNMTHDVVYELLKSIL